MTRLNPMQRDAVLLGKRARARREPLLSWEAAYSIFAGVLMILTGFASWAVNEGWLWLSQ